MEVIQGIDLQKETLVILHRNRKGVKEWTKKISETGYGVNNIVEKGGHQRTNGTAIFTCTMFHCHDR